MARSGIRMRLTAENATCMVLVLLALASCSAPFAGPAQSPIGTQDVRVGSPEPIPVVDGLSPDDARTLVGLVKVDDYPLYSMRYYGAYNGEVALSAISSGVPGHWAGRRGTLEWGCSLFATLVLDSDMLYGRNFDWQFSPALLLYTDPPDGYASVSMVDVAYLFADDEVRRLEELSLVERSPLLEAPGWPFDGMNEKGLVVGMAAVPDSPMPRDLGKATLSSLGAIREILDHAANVEQAVEILSSYNIDWSGGPALHYLVADDSGQAALIEYNDGAMVVLRNEEPWHIATNHLRARINEGAPAPCARYERIEANLDAADGQLDEAQAMNLLGQVAQPSTQWSVLYGLSDGTVRVAMGGEYAEVDRFALDMED